MSNPNLSPALPTYPVEVRPGRQPAASKQPTLPPVAEEPTAAQQETALTEDACKRWGDPEDVPLEEIIQVAFLCSRFLQHWHALILMSHIHLQKDVEQIAESSPGLYDCLKLVFYVGGRKRPARNRNCMN